MKAKIKIGVEIVSRTGLTATEFSRSVPLKRGMRVAVVGTTTVGHVQNIVGDSVTFLSDTGPLLTERAKYLRAIL
jgi:hypothetical protein